MPRPGNKKTRAPATKKLYLPPPDRDARYIDLLLKPVDACAKYQPKFGSGKAKGKGVSLERFKVLYGEDPFYHWVGLDSPLMYAAHKAAGGMTSIYRQLGHGCEKLFRAVIQDELGLSDEEVRWSYEVEKKDKSRATLTLDARIDARHLAKKADARRRVVEWVVRCGRHLELPKERIAQMHGAVFEARQGYKSADAKRQNADLQFAMNASMANYLPILSIISTQVSEPVVRRYKTAKMLVMTGNLSNDDTISTYAFFRNIVGFELDRFFERNSVVMRRRCQRVFEAILAPA